MREAVGHEAAKPNPALEPLSVLVGTWKTVGTHPLVPGTTFHGRTTFDRLEGGAFLIMHSQIDEPEIPSGIAVFGTDDTTGECSMLYFDERGVSRRYEVSLQGNEWKWWRSHVAPSATTPRGRQWCVRQTRSTISARMARARFEDPFLPIGSLHSEH